MNKLKDLLLNLDSDDGAADENEIEVFADSVKQALELASNELKTDIAYLDYDILEKGNSGFLDMGRKPYRLIIRQSDTATQYKDILDIEKKLSNVFVDDNIDLKKVDKNADGKCIVRVTKSGIWLAIHPAQGHGTPVTIPDVRNKLNQMRISNVDFKKMEKAVSKQAGKPVKIGEWLPNPSYDSKMTVEITDDEMKALVSITPPYFSGRHMELDDVLVALKDSGVVAGINEEQISQYLENMDYSMVLVAAEGIKSKNGRDAYIDYKVRIDKSHIVFEEDEKGQVDFRNLDLLENVVVGQLLAVKVPAEEGIPGRTVTNRILPVKSGKDMQLRYGKGTILSKDGRELTAEINGQVLFQYGKISVDPLHVVKGDVSYETGGTVTAIGSVLVTGSVLDNFEVKAAGNIEVRGTVQKAFLEAGGNIVIRQGIIGREEAVIESTGGSIYAKFIQSSKIIAEKDVIVPEGILHSNVDAGGRILCTGRRAKIVGGTIRAAEEINARFLGSDTFTKTDVSVGINPKVLQQITDMKSILKESSTELDEINKNLKTLNTQKAGSGGKLTPDKEELYNKYLTQKQKLSGRINEINIELDELKAYLNILEHKGKVCVEQTIYPGVDIHIKDDRFSVKDEYTNIKFTLENEGIRLSEYEAPVFTSDQTKLMAYTRVKK